MAPTLLSLEITPKTPADQQKLARGLQVLAAEDVELLVSPGSGHACTTIGTTGPAHLDRVVDRLRREFEVEAAVGKPYWTVTGTGYQPPPGADGDDDNASRVGVPRRPAPTPRPAATSVPEPADDSEVP